MKFTSTGTSVRERTYDASMAKTTARAMGVKRNFAGPVRKTTETKTMQMVSVETSVGVAISAAPMSTASCKGCLPMWRWMFSMVTVASSTRMPMASARPPRVMVFIVSPIALSTMMELRIESGMEMAMMSVLRQLPRKSRIIKAVRLAAMTPSRRTPTMEALTKMDWSKSSVILRPLGAAAREPGRTSFLIWLTMSSVETEPVFMMVSRAAGLPLARATFCCTDQPSRTMRDVTHVDERAVDGLDGHVVQDQRIGGAGVGADGVFVGSDLRGA